MFLEGIVYDPESIAQSLMKRFPLNDLQKLLVEIMFGNLHRVVQHLSQLYPSFFLCHIVDILTSIGKLPSDPRTEFEGLNYPEYYFYNYVTEIIAVTALPVEIPCDYIFHNLGGLQNAFEIMNKAALLRIPSGNITNMVKYFNEHNLQEISQNIYKIKSMECIQRNDYGNSLFWAISSGNDHLRFKIEKSIIDIAAQNSKQCIQDIISSVPSDIRNDSGVIIFFLQYLQFIKFIEDNNITKAGEMLVKFFLQDTAPEEFYENILMEAAALFENGLVLSYFNFFTVLKAYEKVCNRNLSIKKPCKGFIERLSGVLAHSASLSING